MLRNKAIARKIAKKGFSIKKMKNSARLGKGVYISNRPGKALKESQSGKALLRVKPSQQFKRIVVDMRRPTPQKIRSLVRVKDLRGSVKNRVAGPKLGRKLGRYAGTRGRVVRYQSRKAPAGVNYFIPRSQMVKHPRIIKNIQVKEKSGCRKTK